MNALGGAIGPLSMEFIYERTKDTIGPGTMFIFASFLYFVGTMIVISIPVGKADENSLPLDDTLRSAEIEEPLLASSNNDREQI